MDKAGTSAVDRRGVRVFAAGAGEMRVLFHAGPDGASPPVDF